MAAKRLKSKASKIASFVLAGALVGSGLAVSLQNSFSADAASSQFKSDYASKQEAIDAGYALNVKIAEEGMVLLKNKNKALPIPAGQGLHATKVSVFGVNGAKPNGGSGANGGDTSSGQVGNAGTVYKTLEAVGYKVNPYLQEFYTSELGKVGADGKAIADTDYKIKADFNANIGKLSQSYASYSDAAIIVLGVGDTSDEYDATNNPDGIKYEKQYNKAQYELIDHVTDSGVFDKVIVLINRSYPMEIDAIKKNDKVDAILLISEPGTNGLVAAGSILCGDVNPSGRLADTYPVNQQEDPSYINYSTVNLGRYATEIKDGQPVPVAATSGYTDYEEGIYVGYRYWETRAIYEDEEWYDNHVSYTFGYGLSYTDFKWEVTPRKTAGSELKLNDVLKFDVKVTNKGSVAGKDVVQLYLNAPYTDGGIEKAENVLEDFAKTDLLQPEESQTVTLSVKVRDLASYDWNDANGNGIRGYELDNGTYNLRIMHNAHYDAAKDTQVAYTVNDTSDNKSIYVEYAETGVKIENQFEYMNAYAAGYKGDYATDKFHTVVGATGFDAPLSRSQDYIKDGLKGLQVPATAPTHVITTFDKLKTFAGQNIDDSETSPWYAEDMPKFMTNADREEKPEADVVLSQLVGKAYDDPLWDKLLDELTLLEMQTLINEGGWNTGAIEYIGKPSTRDTDGPKGWSGSGRGGETGNMFCAEPMIAATFNTDLIFELGKNMGDQGLWGSTDRTDGGSQESYTCWYAPGMNIHRGSFDGRLAEYYSEDPVLMGKMAAAVSNGIRSKGGYITMKHFALHNDGSTVRSGFGVSGESVNGLYAWVNEQALREVYLRGYQICANEGGANDAMASFTRFGYINAGACYALNTKLFRQEWGCKGYIVTDIVLDPFQDGNQLIRAGGNLLLTAAFIGDTAKIHVVDTTTGEALKADDPIKNADITATQVTAMRNATKGILWSVANSNAMQVPPAAEVRYAPASKVLNATLNTEVSLEVNSAKLGTGYAYSNVTYAVTGGNLPAGLTMNRSGVISGTPTVAGTFNVKITASANGYTPATVEYTIVVGDTSSADILAAIAKIDEALKSNNADLASIKAELAAIKSTVGESDTSLKAKIADLETKVKALEESGCNGSVGLTTAGIAFAVTALGVVAYVVVKRLKKNEK